MSTTGQHPLCRYPEGYAEGGIVVGSIRFFAMNPRAPRDRRGRIVKSTRSRLHVRVQWDGCKSHQEVDIRTIVVLAQGRFLDERQQQDRMD